MKYYFDSDYDRSCYQKIKGRKQKKWVSSNYTTEKHCYRVLKKGKEIFVGDTEEVAIFLNISNSGVYSLVSRTKQGHRRKDGIEVEICETS